MYCGIGTTEALGAGTSMKICGVMSLAGCALIPHVVSCSFVTPTSIALSSSARTDVLSCSAGTDGAETDRYTCY